MKRYLLVALKGVAMGAADVIPGVSGGTIAFITGIYQELISSLNSIGLKSLKLLLKGRIGEFWREINGNFLLSLFSGILLSIFTLARLMNYLLTHHPIPLWSFFFGLIIASALYILKGVKGWRLSYYLSLVVGIVIALYISLVSPTESSEALWAVFLSGAIAICAMILPGISGSFILLLIGKYSFMMRAIEQFDIVIIATFIVGAAIGLLAFSHFLNWLLKRYYNEAITLLAGFMVGSLLKIWPWKIESSQFIGIDRAILPSSYKELGIGEPQLFLAITFVVIGFLLLFILEYFAKTMEK